jgi:hypothetical protein
MPEFILDYGTPEAAARFKALDGFTEGYITAAFWLLDESVSEELDRDATFADLAPSALDAMIADCAAFQRDQRDLLEAAYEERLEDYDMERAGHDFWLTRNHHGAGFWDRGLGRVGNCLSTCAHTYPETDLYLGDDGLLYVV